MASTGVKLLGMVVLWTALIATGLWVIAVFFWGWSTAKPTDGVYLYEVPAINPW